MASPSHRRRILLSAFVAVGGTAMVVIGLRFLLLPEAASRFFGIDATAVSRPLAHVVALRDIWIGLVLLGSLAFGQWRVIALWLALAVPVCFGDAWIAAQSSGRVGPVAFHLAAGIAATVLALACHREARRIEREAAARGTGAP